MLKRIVAVFTGKGEVRTVTENLPDIKEHEVRVKIHAYLISPGTEIANVTAQFLCRYGRGSIGVRYL